MRLVIARCSVDYVGRLTAHLPEAVRLLIVKADGSVLVHSDGGSYKPLNWMSPPCRLTEEPGLWTVTGKSGETLIITLTEVVSDTSVDLGVDPGLVKDGVEAHLQELLAVQLDLLGVDLFLDLLHGAEGADLVFPAGGELGISLLEVGQFALSLLKLLLAP